MDDGAFSLIVQDFNFLHGRVKTQGWVRFAFQDSVFGQTDIGPRFAEGRKLIQGYDGVQAVVSPIELYDDQPLVRIASIECHQWQERGIYRLDAKSIQAETTQNGGIYFEK